MLYKTFNKSRVTFLHSYSTVLILQSQLKYSTKRYTIKVL